MHKNLSTSNKKQHQKTQRIHGGVCLQFAPSDNIFLRGMGVCMQGGFTSFEKHQWSWIISPNKDEHKKKHLKPPASNVTILNTTNLMACDVVPLEQIPFCWIPVTRRSRARRVVVVDFASVFLAQPAGHRRSSQKRLARVVSSFPRWRLKKKRLPYHPCMAYVPTFGGFWW